jgi:hypothetical protein
MIIYNYMHNAIRLIVGQRAHQVDATLCYNSHHYYP